MAKVKQLQDKVDATQANVAAKVDEAQAKIQETIDSAQNKVQELIDNAQAKVDEVQAKFEAVEDKVEGKIDWIKSKITYGYDFVRSAIETAGVNPRNLIDIAKIVIGQETVAKPIVVPFLASLVVVQVSEKPKSEDLKNVVEANM